MFLTVLPKHLILFILDEWLCSWNDFSSLDLAMTNKELRFYLYTPLNLQYDSIRKLNSDITITIRNGEQYASLMKWKEKRLLEITKLCLDHSNLYDDLFEYCMLGNKFSTLTQLEIIDTSDVELQLIFYGNLPNLRKFSMKDCSILICREALNLDKLFSATNIKELSLNTIDCTLRSGGSKAKPVWDVPLADCTKLYLWMAKCCPQLTNLCLDDCYGVHYTNILPILRALPSLKHFTYRVFRQCLDRLLANSPESAATFRDIVPLSVEGINGDSQYHLPHLTSLNISIVEIPESWLVRQALEVMFQGCDLRELQTLELHLYDDIPSDYYNRLLNFLLEEGDHLKSVCLDMVDENTSPLLAAICKYCTSLEHWELNSMTIEDSAIECLALPNTLNYLHSLSLNSLSMSNASMEMICRSSVANQLTKLSLIHVSILSLEAYHLIVHSFPKLQYLKIDMSFHLDQTNDSELRVCFRSVVQWLDELFSRQCVFADTIETICLSIPSLLKCNFEWTTKENVALSNELFHDHMLKHWRFRFPALQSFSMTWKINHHLMNSLMVRRLLNCTKLHSIELDLWKNESRNQYKVMNIKNRPEVIRQMREGYY